MSKDRPKPKKETPTPKVPECPVCKQSLIHCTCKNNELKK